MADKFFPAVQLYVRPMKRGLQAKLFICIRNLMETSLSAASVGLCEGNLWLLSFIYNTGIITWQNGVYCCALMCFKSMLVARLLGSSGFLGTRWLPSCLGTACHQNRLPSWQRWFCVRLKHPQLASWQLTLIIDYTTHHSRLKIWWASPRNHRFWQPKFTCRMFVKRTFQTKRDFDLWKEELNVSSGKEVCIQFSCAVLTM